MHLTSFHLSRFTDIMNDRRIPIICLIMASLVYVGNSQEINTNDWRPDTKNLDFAAKHGDSAAKDRASTLAHDLKRFYQLLRDKQWHETYELRAKAFRKLVPESVYLAGAKKAEKIWGLVDYDVLSVEFQSFEGATNMNQAMVICKFTELPDSAVSYSTVFWHKEDGVWKCLSAGPNKLSIFHAMTLPIINWGE